MTDTTRDKVAIDRGHAKAKRLLAPPPAAREIGKDAPVRDLILAIGDSWFNYWPRGDILDVLEARLGHLIERRAAAGRKLAEMLYLKPPSLLDAAPAATDPDGVEISWLTGRLRDMKPVEKARVRAILVSAGGNDVAGDERVLHDLVNPKDPRAVNAPLLNEDRVLAAVDGRLREHYATLLACITHACDKTLNSRPPILLHGYAHPVADGRGVLGRVWLEPTLRGLGYVDLVERKEIMKELIDRLNKMQKAVIGDNPEFKHVRHVDVRPALINDETYKLYWQNELHPTIPMGFAEVSKLFIAELDSLLDAVPPSPDPGATPSTSSGMHSLLYPAAPAPVLPVQQRA